MDAGAESRERTLRPSSTALLLAQSLGPGLEGLEKRYEGKGKSLRRALCSEFNSETIPIFGSGLLASRLTGYFQYVSHKRRAVPFS